MPITTEFLLIAYALSFVGVHYRWGGKNPLDGFDCSGFVAEPLKAAGVLHYDEFPNSQQMFDHFTDPRYGTECVRCEPACLVFYGPTRRQINHVAFCVNDMMMLEAAGGDESTVNKEFAKEKNAFVKMRRVDYRRELRAIVRPKYPWLLR